LGVLSQVCRAGREHLNECVALTIPLDFKGALNSPFSLPYALYVCKGHPFNEYRCLEVVEEFAHVEGVTCITGVPATGACYRDLTDQGCGCHLAPCHPVDRVVDKEDGQFLAAVSGLYGFIESYGCKVPVALVEY